MGRDTLKQEWLKESERIADKNLRLLKLAIERKKSLDKEV